MAHQHFAVTTTTPYDLTRIIRQVEREIAAGLNIHDNAAVAALAKQFETDLAPRIIPDRRYSITELVKQFGYTRGLFYKRHKHLIRKDGRKSFVLGRELLADIESTPTLSGITVQASEPPRRRGRPRKIVVESQSVAPSEAADADASS